MAGPMQAGDYAGGNGSADRVRLSSAMMKQQISERPTKVGDLIEEWRTRRRLSQLDLALEAGVSQRHLSFVESGRSAPSRDMVETLSEHLNISLRERNVLLLSAGFAPSFA